MMAVKETTRDVLSLAAVCFLPETRVWGPGPEKQPSVGAGTQLSSTTRWGCGYVYGGIASGETDQRMYASVYGRFGTADPYKASAGPKDPGSWNRYSYVQGDPVNFNDPQGLFLQQQPVPGLPVQLGCQTWDLFDAACSSMFFNGTGVLRAAQPINDTFKGGVPLPGAQLSDLAPTCVNGLQTAIPNTGAAGVLAALGRAQADMDLITTAANANGIPPALLAAIGLRETGFQNIPQQGGGLGMGIFQIDLGANPSVTAAQASNPVFAANFAANLLATNMAQLAASFPNLTPAQLLQATAASYNFGTSNISGNPNTIDAGTTGNNYGGNVLNLMTCFNP